MAIQFIVAVKMVRFSIIFPRLIAYISAYLLLGLLRLLKKIYHKTREALRDMLMGRGRRMRLPRPISMSLLPLDSHFFCLARIFQQEECYQSHAQRQSYTDGEGNLWRDPGTNKGLSKRTEHHSERDG